MLKALESSVKAKTIPLNLNAFQAGFEYKPNLEEKVVTP
jgi:Pyruvate/2-oxoacid:ferredoxin oxidoreductase gamma subunit